MEIFIIGESYSGGLGFSLSINGSIDHTKSGVLFKKHVIGNADARVALKYLDPKSHNEFFRQINLRTKAIVFIFNAASLQNFENIKEYLEISKDLSINLFMISCNIQSKTRQVSYEDAYEYCIKNNATYIEIVSLQSFFTERIIEIIAHSIKNNLFEEE